MVACAQGARGRLVTKASSGDPDWTSGTIERFAFYNEAVRKTNKIVHPPVITGDRSEHAERARRGPNFYGGPIMLPVSPADLRIWLPRIFGAAESGSNPYSYGLATTLPTFALLIDKVTKTYEFQDCYVDKAMIFGRQSGPNPGAPPNFLTLLVWIVAKGFDNGVTFPSTTLTKTAPYAPYIFEDGVLTLKSAARETKAFKLLVDNHLRPRYVNNLNPTTICPHHRTVALQTQHPFDDDTDDLELQDLSGAAAGTLVLTNGSNVVTFNFAQLQAPIDIPVIPGKVEIDLTLHHVSRMLSSTDEIAATIAV